MFLRLFRYLLMPLYVNLTIQNTKAQQTNRTQPDRTRQQNVRLPTPPHIHTGSSSWAEVTEIELWRSCLNPKPTLMVPVFLLLCSHSKLYSQGGKAVHNLLWRDGRWGMLSHGALSSPWCFCMLASNTPSKSLKHKFCEFPH